MKNYNYKLFLLFLIINFFISTSLNFFYIYFSPTFISIYANIYTLLALFSNNIMLYLILFIVFSILYLFFSIISKKFFFFLLPVLFTLFQIILILDILIYKFFKYHINGLVLNVIFTKDGIKSLDLPISNFIYFSLIILLFLAFEFILIKFLKKLSLKLPTKIFLFILLLSFTILTTEKFTYAILDLKGSTEITRYSKLFPLYQPLTIKKLAKKYFNIKVAETKNFKLKKRHYSIDYPKKPLKKIKLSKYPNILWIIIDAWRKDMFNKELTPNILNFSKNSIVFYNHKSSGIATRFGIFGLFYGIYGNYWHKFLAEQKSPVFIDELQKLNYDFKILTTTSLNYPEFRKTIFVNIQEYIKDKWEEKNSAIIDKKLVDEFITWHKNRKNNKPFFSFIFMNSPHAKTYLPEYQKYKLNKKIKNYLIVGRKNVTTLKIAYKNAVYTDDQILKKLFDYINQSKLYKNTIILISADHGEEFYEHGHVGHTSAFTPEQNDVPLILYIPGFSHKKIYKLTSHLDIVPTMMKLLGYTTKYKYYSNGFSLFDKKKHKYVIANSWTNFAVIYSDYRFIFSTATYKIGLFEIRDNNFKLIKNKELFNSRVSDFIQIIKDFSWFYK